MTEERPRPQYGEYASPEQQAAAMGVPHPVPATPAASERPPAASPAAPARSRSWDIVLSVALLAYGLFNVVSGLRQYADLGAVIQQIFELQGVGHYTSTALTSALGIVINVSNVVLFVATAAVTLAFLRRGRRAFWVPLVGGVLAGIVAATCLIVLMTGDPAFVAFVSTGK